MRRRLIGVVGGTWVVLLVVTRLSSAPGQVAALRLEHDARSCVNAGDFPFIEATFVGPAASELRSARVYFKGTRSLDWYYVEMVPDAAGLYQAVLPKPLLSARQVDYYLVGLSGTFDTAQTQEYAMDVLDGTCADRRAAPGLLASSLVVRGTAAQQAAVPAGFSADGIGSFISSTGQVVSGTSLAGGAGAAGGGISGATIGIVSGVVGAAATGVAVAASGGDGESGTVPATSAAASGMMTTTTTTTVPATTTSIPPSTTTLAPSSTLDGNWGIMQTVGASCDPADVGRATTSLAKFMQNGSNITADINGPDISGKILGNVSGSRFNLAGPVRDSGFIADIRVDGSWSGDSMSGSYREDFRDDGCVVTGEFSGRRR